MKTRRVLCAGGFDPSGRAGLLADAEAVRAFGALPLLVPALHTAQGKKTFQLEKPSTAMVRAQVRALRELGRIDAVKFGALAGPAYLDALVELLPKNVPWVVDPVIGTSRGQLLSRLRRGDYLRLAHAHVVLTPNVAELAWLLTEPVAKNPLEAAAQGARLQARGFGAVLVKGGHFRGPPVDLLCTREAVLRFSARRLHRTPQSHRGTGCRLASAIAAQLSSGVELPAAVAGGKHFIARYLRSL